MRKYFCNKCGNEIINPKNEDGSESPNGYIHFGRERRKIWVAVESLTDEHFCKDCQIDAIKALDYRPKKDDRIPVSDMLEPWEKDMEGDSTPYVPPKKKSKIPLGLHKTGGIVE